MLKKTLFVICILFVFLLSVIASQAYAKTDSKSASYEKTSSEETVKSYCKGNTLVTKTESLNKKATKSKKCKNGCMKIDLMSAECKTDSKQKKANRQYKDNGGSRTYSTAYTVAISPTYFESDSGINLAQRGSILLNSLAEISPRIINTDVCEEGLILSETVCLPGNNCQMIRERCKFGTSCEEGKCVLNELSLTDSDTGDLGAEYTNRFNIFSKGNIVLSDGRSLEDSCVDRNTVRESMLRISGGTTLTSSEDIRCPAGMRCSEGRCTGATVRCNALIRGHNNADEKRFNLVFVGTDYHKLFPDHDEAISEFKKDINSALGTDEKAYGLFSIEPFKSNKDKFNIWYVDAFVDADPLAIESGTMTEEERERREKAVNSQLGLSSACTYGHKIVLSLDAMHGWNNAADSLINFATYRETIQNSEYVEDCTSDLSGCYETLITQTQKHSLPIIDINHDRCIGGIEEIPYYNIGDFCQNTAFYNTLCADDTEERLRYICSSNDNLGEGLAHEMAHVFGISDVSVAREDDRPATPENYPSPNSGTFPNCFAADTVEECEENAPWRHLLGNGCGEPGVIDCTPSDPDYNKEIICQPGCIGGLKSYRSIRYNLMPYGFALRDISNDPTHVFGEWDAYYIGKKIDAYLDIGVTRNSYTLSRIDVGDGVFKGKT
jgi:hypothetical protein